MCWKYPKLDPGRLSRMIYRRYGHYHTYKGWTLYERTLEPDFSFDHVKRGAGHPSHDRTIRSWVHKDEREFRGTVVGLVASDPILQTPSRQNRLNWVANQKTGSIMGWRLANTTASSAAGPAPDTKVRSWKNNDGRRFRGTNRQLVTSDPILQRGRRNDFVGMVAHGRTKSAFGWRLDREAA